MINWSKTTDILVDFLQRKAKETNAKKLILGLSGGLDSAIVAVLAKKAVGDNLLCIIMPSHYSSASSQDDAMKLCELFDIKYKIIEITPMLKAYEQNMCQDRLRVGNYSARMRMSVLYDISSQENGVVVGTSNKSEILLGYGTIYGDTACAFNPIGQIYKSDAFEFAKYLKITDEIINKKPSADLWEGQNDEEELGYSYAVLDDVLKKLTEQKESKDSLKLSGIDENLVQFVQNKVKSNEFKSKMPEIAQI